MIIIILFEIRIRIKYKIWKYYHHAANQKEYRSKDNMFWMIITEHESKAKPIMKAILMLRVLLLIIIVKSSIQTYKLNCVRAASPIWFVLYYNCYIYFN